MNPQHSTSTLQVLQTMWLSQQPGQPTSPTCSDGSGSPRSTPLLKPGVSCGSLPVHHQRPRGP